MIAGALGAVAPFILGEQEDYMAILLIKKKNRGLFVLLEGGKYNLTIRERKAQTSTNQHLIYSDKHHGKERVNNLLIGLVMPETDPVQNHSFRDTWKIDIQSCLRYIRNRTLVKSPGS